MLIAFLLSGFGEGKCSKNLGILGEKDCFLSEKNEWVQYHDEEEGVKWLKSHADILKHLEQLDIYCMPFPNHDSEYPP